MAQEDFNTAQDRETTPHASDDEDDDEEQRAGNTSSTRYPAYFFPPLAQQRWVFCLQVLKKEDIKSVMEFGCGEGSVIQPMTNGASHIDTFPDRTQKYEVPLHQSNRAPDAGEDLEQRGRDRTTSADSVASSSLFSDPSSSSSSPLVEILKALPPLRPEDKELHLSRIAGLDVSSQSLKEAIRFTAPSRASSLADDDEESYTTRDRWEDLKLEFWEGSLDVHNAALDDYEACIMTEVIEHLPEPVLQKFPDLLFGKYRPRIVVITTPNYDFNRFFDRRGGRGRGGSGAEEETVNGFKDPTGRTERVFRDDDHKFEWTKQEFKDWCDDITLRYEYTVEYSGVGTLRNYFGRGGFHTPSSPPSIPLSPPAHIQEKLSSVPNPDTCYATQCAVFRRRVAYDHGRSPRDPTKSPLAFYGYKAKLAEAALSPPGSASELSPSNGESVENANATIKRSSVAQAPKSPTRSSNSIVNPEPAASPQPHTLLKTHEFPKHPSAGNPQSPKKILELVDDLMRNRMRVGKCSLRELWGRREVARACGGYIGKLVEAVVRMDAQVEEDGYESDDEGDGGEKQPGAVAEVTDELQQVSVSSSRTASAKSAPSDSGITNVSTSGTFDISYDASILASGGQVEDAVFLHLTDFIEPDFEAEYRELEAAEANIAKRREKERQEKWRLQLEADNAAGASQETWLDELEEENGTAEHEWSLSKPERRSVELAAVNAANEDGTVDAWASTEQDKQDDWGTDLGKGGATEPLGWD